MDNKEEIARQISQILQRFVEIDLVYIYGSFLNRNDYEDIDIACVLKEGHPPWDNLKLAMIRQLEFALIPEKNFHPHYGPETPFSYFDLKNMRRLPSRLQQRIVGEGRCLYSRDETTRIRFETALLCHALDFKRVDDLFDQAALERLTARYLHG